MLDYLEIGAEAVLSAELGALPGYTLMGEETGLLTEEGKMREEHLWYFVGAYDYKYRKRSDRRAAAADDRTPRYICNNRYRMGRTDPAYASCASRKERELRQELFAILGEYARGHILLEEIIQEKPQPTEVAQRQAEITQLESQIARADQAIQRWDRAFEAGDLNLDEWRAKVTPHKEARSRAAVEIKKLRAQEEVVVDPEHRIAKLRGLIEKLAQLGPEHDPAEIKVLLRQLIRKIILHEGKISRIEFS